MNALVLALGCKLDELAYLLDLSCSDLRRKKDGDTQLTLGQLVDLSDRIGVSLEDLDFDRPNWLKVGIAAHSYFQRTPLGENWFQEGGYSRFRTALNAILFVEKKRDPLSALLMTRRVGLSPQYLVDSSHEGRTVSIQWIARIFEEAARLGVSKADFYQMGLQTGMRFLQAEKTGLSPLAPVVNSSRTLAEVYERIVEEHAHFFDQNYDYRVTSLTREKCVFRSRPSQRAQDASGVQKVGSAIGCIQRTGAVAAFPAHGGRGIVPVKHTRCIFHGDSECEFEVDLQNTVRSFTPNLSRFAS